MPDQPQTPRSHLFTLRVWHEDLGDGRQEWRGKLHHVANDEVTYFRGWAALLPVVLAMLRRAGVTTSVDNAPDWVEEEETMG
jgi:hypothetical protein